MAILQNKKIIVALFFLTVYLNVFFTNTLCGLKRFFNASYSNQIETTRFFSTVSNQERNVHALHAHKNNKSHSHTTVNTHTNNENDCCNSSPKESNCCSIETTKILFSAFSNDKIDFNLKNNSAVFHPILNKICCNFFNPFNAKNLGNNYSHPPPRLFDLRVHFLSFQI